MKHIVGLRRRCEVSSGDNDVCFAVALWKEPLETVEQTAFLAEVVYSCSYSCPLPKGRHNRRSCGCSYLYLVGLTFCSPVSLFGGRRLFLLCLPCTYAASY
ncbi:UNVERIFIED_CONTAM: hypothetical protein K2H54_076067 [Gekko kuhli]